MTTCATCIYFCQEPGTIRPQYGVCFRRHVFDGYGWTTGDREACERYVSRLIMPHYKAGLCPCCSKTVDKADRFCRHCGMEFMRNK